MNHQKALQEMIHSGKTLVVPDAYDAISARIIQYVGFEAVQCSGYSISISKCYPDESLVSIEENLNSTQEIASAVDLPVMADGEHGYGQGEVFRDNVRRFIKTGIAGINIEDQNLWNPQLGEKIVPLEIMREKIAAVLTLKKELGMPYFLFNARTDALTNAEDRNAGLKRAIDRANQYLQAGADLAFVRYVRTRNEIELLKREIAGPLSIAAGLPYNILEFSIKDCQEIGVARVSLPSVMVFSAMQGAIKTIEHVRNTGAFESIIQNNLLVDTASLQQILKMGKVT